MKPMAAPIVKLNDPKNLDVEMVWLGREENPVLIVDNALANAEEVRQYALGSRFSCLDKDYPGYQSTCALRGVRAIGGWVAWLLWTEGFKRGEPEAHLRGLEMGALFAAFAPARNQKYRNVHTHGNTWLALHVYLTPGEDRRSGTAFWRHAPTGLESACAHPKPLDTMLRVDDLFHTRLLHGTERVRVKSPAFSYEDWLREINEDPISLPFPARDYGKWKLLEMVDARYNRLVAYPAWQFHSIAMKKNVVASSLDEARLTLNAQLTHPLFEQIQRLPAAPVTGIDYAP
jgi:hypothetical protein